ncbi:uncharacterized protein LOC118756323, partial [Rhagoletis pomonella]|uniref:uncharacterized protein LOC118756323 n=1 Tax=Rhagoletis pomonella TaxID=28610 RepID=UPI00177F986E
NACAISDESGWQKQRKKKNRRAKPPPMPLPGQPGALDDRHREGLSGSGVKWYLRYLEQGKPQLRWKSEPNKQVHLPAPAAKQRSGPQQQQQHRPAPAGWRRSGEPPGHKGDAVKRGSNQITPPETPSTKRQRDQRPTPTSWPKSLAGPAGQGQVQESATQQPSYSETLKGIRVAVLPCEYPAAALSPEDLTRLQDAIMEEVFKGWSHPLVFCGVYFRSGMLLVDCRDEKTATWLAEKAPALEGWKGPGMCTKRGDEIPPVHNITVFLPRSADKSAEFALGLLKAQNEGIHTSAWKVVCSTTEENELRLFLGIDEESYVSIKRAGFNLNYRFSFVTVRPWRQKATGSKESEAQETQIDVVAGSPAAQTAESTSGLPAEQPLPAETPAPASTLGHTATTTSAEHVPSTQELLSGLDLRRLELDKRNESELQLSDLDELHL